MANAAILTAIYEKYSPFLEASAPRSIDRFLYEGERQRSESFTSFIAAKQLARQEMETQLGEAVCDRLCGRVLLRQSNLNDLQRELLMLRSPVLRSFDEIANLLRTLDRPEMLAKAQGSTKNYATFAENEEAPEDDEASEYDNNDDGLEESSSQDEDGNHFLYFEDRVFSEAETLEIVAYHSAYRDVRKELQKKRNERGFVKRSRDSGKSKGKSGYRPYRVGKGKGKFNKGSTVLKSYEDDLLSRTRCFNCDELGHLSKNCPLKQERNKSGASASGPRKQFLMTSTGPQVFMHAAQRPAHQVPNEVPYRLMIFHAVQCKPFEALVDTAAEEAVIGHQAMEQLEKELKNNGLQVIWRQDGPLPGAGGIGGAAKVRGLAHVPIGVAKNNGVLQFTVLEDGPGHQTPPLLPISWLESVGAMIDCKNDQMILQNGTSTDLRKLPTKHRAVSIMDYADTGWELPMDMRRDPNVDPFVIPNNFEGVVHQDAHQERQVKVWLLVDGKMHHLATLPADRWAMVLPSECGLLQDQAALEPQRLTHAYLRSGKHQIIRDYWQDPQGNRSLAEPWHGSVVFASSQHVVVPMENSDDVSLQADETSLRAFANVGQSAPSSSSRPSSSWANIAQRQWSSRDQNSAHSRHADVQDHLGDTIFIQSNNISTFDQVPHFDNLVTNAPVFPDEY